MPLPRITPASVRRNWQFVASGVEKGLSGAETLRQIRAGGESIRTQWFYDARRIILAAVDTGERMTTVPSPLPVPGAVFGESPYNTRQQFYVNALVTGTDPDTGQVITRWVTAESDVELTADDWDAEITRAATWGATGTRILRPIIRERRPYRRARL